jgi:hypothetical protein
VRIEYTRYSSSAAFVVEPNPRPRSARDTSDAASTSPCPSAPETQRVLDPLVKLFKQTEHWNGVSAKSTPRRQPMEQGTIGGSDCGVCTRAQVPREMFSPGKCAVADGAEWRRPLAAFALCRCCCVCCCCLHLSRHRLHCEHKSTSWGGVIFLAEGMMGAG